VTHESLPPPPGWVEPDPPKVRTTVRLGPPLKGEIVEFPRNRHPGGVKSILGLPSKGHGHQLSPAELRERLGQDALEVLHQIINSQGTTNRYRLDAIQIALRYQIGVDPAAAQEERELDTEILEIADEVLGVVGGEALTPVAQVISLLDRLNDDDLDRVCEHLEQRGVLEPSDETQQQEAV
jgi:hypothetical protein